MARPKKPIVLHRLQGTGNVTRLKDRINELQLPAGPMGKPPAWMPLEGKREWMRLTEDPIYSQVLNPLFTAALIEYCFLYANSIDSLRGRLKGGRKFPASDAYRLHSLRMQLGLTPASQSKVQMPANGNREVANAWESVKPPIATAG